MKQSVFSGPSIFPFVIVFDLPLLAGLLPKPGIRVGADIPEWLRGIHIAVQMEIVFGQGQLIRKHDGFKLVCVKRTFRARPA